jgi:hypothetical protein
MRSSTHAFTCLVAGATLALSTLGAIGAIGAGPPAGAAGASRGAARSGRPLGVTATRQRGLGGLLVPTAARTALPRHDGTVDSDNWSGYAVTPSGAPITGIRGGFVVPTAGLVPPGFAATWAGIGGYSSDDLIQAGVAEQSVPGLPVVGEQYYAWYELLPTSAIQLTGCTGESACTVSPGDSITLTINRVEGTTWRIAMGDTGKWNWWRDVTYDSSESSAEWILEAPTLEVAQTVLAPVGTVAFGPASTFTAGGVTDPIAQGDPVTIDLDPGVIAEATPSALSADGEAFDDCAYATSCPQP